MGKRRRSFQRRPPKLDYRTLFLIATEGSKTEPQYFSLFQSSKATIRLKVLPAKHNTAPPQVLQRAKAYARQEQLRKKDEVWLVIDRDQWTENQLEEVYAGCQELDFHLALSNPCFEYWLLLHFEDGTGINSLKDCLEKLKQHLPNFEKGHLEIYKLYPQIPEAMRRAEGKNRPPCEKWPAQNGSTVYLLVEKLYVEMSCLPKD